MKLLWLLPLLLLSACGTFAESDYATTDQAPYSLVRAESDLSPDEQKVARKIIKNATLSLIVKDIDSVRTQIERMADQYNGYVQTGGLNQITLRIEAQYLEQAVAQVETFGEVESRNIRSRDVTDQYYDLDGRIDNLRKSRQRYLELLQAATNVSEILAVEKELERVTLELESLEGRFKLLQDQVAYSSLTVQLEEKVKLGPLGFILYGLWQGIEWLFVRN
ncbi:MAG: DUF4349 domain-containing protein [Bacteroidota bacterium]